MTNIDNLLGIAQQFKNAAATIRAAGSAIDDQAKLLKERTALSEKWVRKDVPRQNELLAQADAKRAVAIEHGNSAISQVREAIAALRADGGAISSNDELADAAEKTFTSYLTYAIKQNPALSHGEAVARSTKWSSNYVSLQSRLDTTAARLEAEHIVHSGGADAATVLT